MKGPTVAGAWWRLARGSNAVLAAIAAAAGAWMTCPNTGWLALVLISAAPLFITVAGNIQNDISDLAIDRQSHPDRPLVTDAISIPTARWVAWAAIATGLTAAILLTIPAVVTVLIVVIGLKWYNDSLSQSPLWGNTLIAFLGSLPVVYGALSVNGLIGARGFVVVAFAAIAFWLHLARELLKDVLDMEGDRLAGRRTLAILQGPRPAMRLAAACMILGAATALWPAYAGWLGILYGVGICLTVLPALLLGAAQCWWRTEESIAKLWSAGIKICMAAGLLWMILCAARM